MESGHYQGGFPQDNRRQTLDIVNSHFTSGLKQLGEIFK